MTEPDHHQTQAIEANRDNRAKCLSCVPLNAKHSDGFARSLAPPPEWKVLGFRVVLLLLPSIARRGIYFWWTWTDD